MFASMPATELKVKNKHLEAMEVGNMDDIIVIKCGGSMIDSLSDDFFKDIKTLQNNGFKPIIVHGGGPAINKLLNEMNIKSEFVNGLRKTTLECDECCRNGLIRNH